MKKNLLATAIISIAFNALSFNIGTNAFEFVFEDTNLSTDIKTLITDDFSAIITRCDLAKINYITPTNGYISYKTLHLELYPSRKIPKKFNQINGTNYLSISKIISDDLQQRLAIHNTYTNAYSICTNFVDFLNSEDLQNISSNDIKNVLYQEKMADARYMSFKTQFVNDLTNIEFFYPPKSSFYIMEAGFNGITQESVWTFIPCRTESQYLQGYIAVFFNNYWHLLSPYDPILEEFLEKAEEKAQDSISNHN